MLEIASTLNADAIAFRKEKTREEREFMVAVLGCCFNEKNYTTVEKRISKSISMKGYMWAMAIQGTREKLRLLKEHKRKKATIYSM